jgi:alginate O-acetyltransferase complex protein AlgI
VLFTTPTFLFLFLPLVLLGYFIIFKRYQNLFLLGTSLLFYSWGERTYLILLLALILANFLFGLLIDGNRKNLNLVTFLTIGANLGALVYFKYLTLFISTLTSSKPPEIHLPLGISFITFHTISYLLDIKKKKIKPERSLLNFALYISLFPHLIAGPIVRFRDIAASLKKRVVTIDSFSEGVVRFITGLFKKVVLADTLAQISDKVFATQPTYLSSSLIWLGLIAYTIQIYLDFSGYSDMAIGLAKMFGFNFPENFNYPYLARSIRDFWRRWHMTLTSWFREYLYIPLGGNRGGMIQTCRNILIVFALTGFWHGASWHFLAWGVYFGVFICLEILFLGKLLDKVWKPLAHLYTLLVVIIGWLFFRADSLNYALFLLKKMFTFDTRGIVWGELLSSYNLVVIFLGILISLAIYKTRLGSFPKLLLSIPLLYSILQVASNTYTPFIYFRF